MQVMGDTNTHAGPVDALTIMRAKGRLHRLNIAICGDIVHSRVARSNLILLEKWKTVCVWLDQQR